VTEIFPKPVEARSTVSSEMDRKAFVRDWIARRLKAGRIAGSGIVGTLLTLPMLAAAQAVGEFVNAAQIEGVTNVEAMPDGSAQLTMSNGTTISVPATDVQIAAGGQVMVSSRIVEIAAEVMAAGGAVGLGAGAIAGGLVGVAGIAAAASDSGSDGAAAPPPLPVLSAAKFSGAVLGVSGGFNSENTGINTATDAASVEVTITDADGVETTTTLPADQFDENGDWAFVPPSGIPQGIVTVTVKSFDADGEEIGSATQQFNVDTIPPTITIDDTGVGADGVLNIAEQEAGITISGTTDAEDGQTVTVTISDGGVITAGAIGVRVVTGAEFSVTTTASGGAWSVVIPATDLAGLADGTTVTVTANVEDAAGNPATATTGSFTTDLSADIEIITIAGDPVASATITAADRVGGFDVTGTATGVEDGQTVTVTLNGQDFTGTVASGAFTVSITEAFLGGLGNGPTTLTLSASVTDVAGNTATDAPAPIAADFTGPSITIDPIATANGDGVLNIAESTGTLEITGSTGLVEPGQTVTVTVNGVTLAGPVTVAADGTWTATATAAELTGLPATGPIDVTADVSDSVGLAAPQASAQVTTDLEAPTITITTPIAGDDVLNIAESEAGISVSGTTTGVEDGQTVTVTLSGSVAATPIIGTATVTGNTFTVEFSDTDLATIGTWPSATVTAEVSDAAGNPATPDTATLGIDLVAPTISINAISGDDQIGLLDAQGDLLITGTTDAEIGQTVTLTFDGQDFTGSVISNSLGGAEPNGWSVSVPKSVIAGLQATALAGDGTLSNIPVTATVTDAAGNPAAAPATTTINADFNGPSISIDPITGDNILNIAENGGAVTISGTTNNVPAGQDITVNVNGTPLGIATRPTTDSWQITLPQGSRPADGASINITADVSDGETDAPTASATLTADLTAPTLAINTISGDDIVNITESGQPLVISGTSDAEEGQIVTLTVPGVTSPVTAPVTAPVDGSGNWQVTLTAQQTAAFVAGQDGQTPNILANVSDLAGNPAPQASRPVTVDVTAPTVGIDPLPLGPDGVMNIAERDAGLFITGTATDAAEVTVTFNGTALAPTPVASGTWVITIPAASLAGLTDGATIDVQADVTDSSGNTAQASASFTTDLEAPTVTITTVSAGDTLTVDELADGLTISGTTSGEATGVVTVDIGGNMLTTPIEPDGSWSLALTQAQVSALNLADETPINITASASDAAGNTSAAETASLTTDFRPIVTINPIGTDGAVDLSVTAGNSISGTTLGAEAGQLVTVTATGVNGQILNATATVAANGTWTLPVGAAVINQLQAGETFTVTATVSNAAGRAATPATADVDAYREAAFLLAETGRTGSDAQLSLFGEEDSFPGGLSSARVTFTSAAGAIAAFPDSNPATPEIEAASQQNGIFILNGNDPANATLGIISIPAINNFDDPLATYIATLGNPDAPFEVTISSDKGGPSQLLVGTAGADTLTAANTDSVIQGKGGDDTIDVSATGANIIVFELDQASNGTDTVIGFTTGTTFQADDIVFLGEANLRGAGDDVQALGAGGTLWANTGFVIFTTALDGTDAATLETAFEGLVGEAAGDVLYFLAGDGTDAAMARVTVNGVDNASVEILANFTGIGDLSLFNPDNVSLPDPVAVDV